MFCVRVCLLCVWFVCVLFVPSVLWYCWLGLLTCKNRLPYNLYCVGGDVKHCSVQSNQAAVNSYWCEFVLCRRYFVFLVGGNRLKWHQSAQYLVHLDTDQPTRPQNISFHRTTGLSVCLFIVFTNVYGVIWKPPKKCKKCKHLAACHQLLVVFTKSLWLFTVFSDLLFTIHFISSHSVNSCVLCIM